MRARRSSRIRSVVTMIATVVCAFAATGPTIAQEGAVRSDPRPTKNPLEGNAQAISNGAAMFRTRCAGCHGPDARGYLGPDLTGFWAAGGTDDRMFDIVRRGVPGTEMPPADPQRVLDKEIWQVLAYVRTLNAVPVAPPSGDPVNGERIFRANCNSCHMVNGRGGQLGPDLSRIGSARSREVLVQRVRRSPEGDFRAGFAPVTITPKDGAPIRGVKKNEDLFSVQVMDTRERIQGYEKDKMKSVEDGITPLMPAFGPDRLSDRELDDVIRYLQTLRGFDPAVGN